MMIANHVPTKLCRFIGLIVWSPSRGTGFEPERVTYLHTINAIGIVLRAGYLRDHTVLVTKIVAQYTT
jgi:hypothetical protein